MKYLKSFEDQFQLQFETPTEELKDYRGEPVNQKVYKVMLDEAKKDKEDAISKIKEFGDNLDNWGASGVSKDAVFKALNNTVEKMALHHYNYLKMRAHTTFDPAATAKWKRLTENKKEEKTEEPKTVREIRMENLCKFKGCPNNSLEDEKYCMKHQFKKFENIDEEDIEEAKE